MKAHTRSEPQHSQGRQVALRTALILLLGLPILVASPAMAQLQAPSSGCENSIPERILAASPGNYLSLLAQLGPGDELAFQSGTYSSGLYLDGLHGQPGRCIHFQGPASGPPAVFTGRDCCNTIDLNDSSYLVFQNLDFDGQGRLGDAVKAQSGAVHHITLEKLTILGHGADQQIVGINSKTEAWNWVIRHNRIEGAGTGIYLGNSDGSEEFVAGLIEYNLIVDTIGYNMQIKHQNGRNVGLGMPAQTTTVIRHNVFSKANNASFGGNARPNLLVGHWPLAGSGSGDVYQIYGNFFYANPSGEPLFQGEGNIAFYQNLLVNEEGSAVWIQPHNDVPRAINVFQNTIVARDEGLRISGGDPSFAQNVVGNAVFAASPLAGGSQVDNVSGSEAQAVLFLVRPNGVPGDGVSPLDLYPLGGQLSGATLDLSAQAVFVDFNRDFDGKLRGGVVRGGYASNSGAWLPAIDFKPMQETALFSDGFETGNLSAWGSSEP